MSPPDRCERGAAGSATASGFGRAVWYKDILLRPLPDKVVAASAVVAVHAAAGESELPADVPPAIRLFNCDFNRARWPPSESLPYGNVRPSRPEDWAEVDAQQYFNWHREFGNNVVYCQASCSSGFALNSRW